MSAKYVDPGLPSSPGRRFLLFFAILGGLATLTLQSYIAGILNPISLRDFLGLQLSHSAKVLLERLSGLGAASEAYKAHLWVDLIYPVAYAVFLACTLALLLTPKPRGFNLLPAYRRAWGLERFRRLRSWSGLRFLPVFAAIFDLGENLLMLLMLYQRIPVLDIFVMLGFVLTLAKWVFIIISIVVGVYAFLVQYRAKR